MDLKQWLRSNPDRAAAWVLAGLGALVLFFGWQGVSTTEFPAEQLPYIISGGVGGALMIGFGATLLISADLRDEWRKLDRIERRLAHSSDLPADEPDGTEGDGSARVVDATIVDGPEESGGNGRRRRRVLSAAERGEG